MGQADRGQRAQVLAEYGLILAIILTLFSVMQLYTKRALQLRYKWGTDFAVGEINRLTKKSYKAQYEPYYTSQNMTLKTDSLTREIAEGGMINKTTTYDLTKQDGWQKIGVKVR